MAGRKTLNASHRLLRPPLPVGADIDTLLGAAQQRLAELEQTRHLQAT